MKTLTRRDFIKASALTGSGLVLGFMIGCKPGETAETPIVNVSPGATNPPAQESDAAATPEPEPTFEPNAYLIIRPDGTITVQAHRSEMGQGVNTSVPMIVADELDADWDSIRIIHAPADSVYGNQVTGGSQSISSSYTPLRRAGAAARMMLIAAAADQWGVSPADCTTENGTVRSGDQTLTYGELALAAAELPVPEDIELKDPADFTIIGTSKGLIDNPQYVDGSAEFCSDIVLEGMLYAVIAHSPVLGGEVVSFDASAAEAVEGVEQVLQVKNGVAVLATSTWAALQGREALDITWDEGAADLSTEGLRADVEGQITLRDDPNIFEAVYEIPYLAHADMEPMCCVADVQADRCDVWAPTQDRQSAQRAASTAAGGLSMSKVFIHVPLIGGGFGRRLQVDYVEEAVEISMLAGCPVKLFWSREEDFKNDYFHALNFHHRFSEAGTLAIRQDSKAAFSLDIRTGAWRSVEEFNESFATNCFQDELAAEEGLDPYTLRMEILSERQQGVLQLAAEKAGWGQSLPDGHAHGIAVHSTFGVTHVAQIAEVSIEDGKIRVHKVTCAVDCGRVINPDGVVAQMEGGIIFGMTAALYGEITIEDGQVQQSNFDDYRLARMWETPVIEVHILETDNSPSGIGEMGVPPIAPAIANAVFALTGNPVRKLPIRIE